MKIIASCGREFQVVNNPHFLSLGIFPLLNLEENSCLDYDFLNFVFNGITQNPLLHAKMAYKYNFLELAKDTYSKNFGKIPMPDKKLCALFKWNEFPDRLAYQVLWGTSPSDEDLTEIVALGYKSCYNSHYKSMNRGNYKHLSINFVVVVLKKLTFEECFLTCCYNGNVGVLYWLLSRKKFLSWDNYCDGLSIAVQEKHDEVIKCLAKFEEYFINENSYAIVPYQAK